MDKKYLKLIPIIVLFVIILGLAYWYIQNRKFYPSTDDAYVQANLVNIAAQVTGPIDQIQVQDHQFVKQGQLLFTILPTNYQAALEQATAQEIQAVNNAKRIMSLVKNGHVSKSDADAAQEQLEVAEAALTEAKLNLGFTNVTAPADGYVTNFTLRVGSTVTPGIALFSIIENNQWWVDANYKETQLERIQPGQAATIYLDMYSNHKFIGHVDQISAGSGAVFSLLPPENATGNWVKVTQRFPVKVLIDNPDINFPLRMGASATVTIDTTSK